MRFESQWGLGIFFFNIATGTSFYFPGYKAAGAWSWTLTSI